MVPIKEIFDIEYGNQFDFSKMEIDDSTDSINFISRSSSNNGFVGKVKPYKSKAPYPAGLITVTMGGSYLLASFVQPAPFYTAQNIKVLTPKVHMSLEQKLFYCAVIQHNRFRYHSHSREANSTFDELVVPSLDEIPDYINDGIFTHIDERPISLLDLCIDTSNWKLFRFDEIFTIRKGFYNKKPDSDVNGTVPFIGATAANNGVTAYTTIEIIEASTKTGDNNNSPITEKIFDGNCITVSNNGSVGYAFYQIKPFTCSHDVNPLYLKDHTLNKYIALFLCTVIEVERYRWAYGRKWRPARMPSSKIKLPITKDGNPNWEFMENFIKSRPYSRMI